MLLLVADACKTYELTWAIRLAAEQSRAMKLEKTAATGAAATTA